MPGPIKNGEMSRVENPIYIGLGGLPETDPFANFPPDRNDPDVDEYLQTYPLPHRFRIFPEAEQMRLSWFRDPRTDYVPSTAAESEDVASLNSYLSAIRGLEGWAANRWVPSIIEMLNLIRVAYVAPESTEATLGKMFSMRERLTDVTRQKVFGLLALLRYKKLAGAGGLPPIEIIHSLRDVNEEAIHVVRTLAALNERLRDLESGKIPRHMSVGMLHKWQNAFLDSRGLIHDINNVNTSMVSSTSLALNLAAGGTPQDIAIGVEKFLHCTRHLKWSTFDSCARLAVSLLKNRADKKGVDIRMEEFPDVEIPEHLRFSIFRAVAELALNAIKYSNSSRISVNEKGRREADPGHIRNVTIFGYINENKLTIVVSDNGVGIPDVQKAFEPGVRFHPNLAEGTGNGLATTRAVARRAGGDLELISEVGTGTTAILTFDMQKWGKTDPHDNGIGGGTTGRSAAIAGPKATGATTSHLNMSALHVTPHSTAWMAGLNRPGAAAISGLGTGLNTFFAGTLPPSPIHFQPTPIPIL